MENRTTKTVKLEVYEDKVNEFKALLWMLKKTLNQEGIDRIRDNYIDPASFDQGNREFIEFLWYFIDMVQIPSIDGDDEIPQIDVYSVAEGVGQGKEMDNNNPAFEDESPFLEDEPESRNVNEIEEANELKWAEFSEMIGWGDSEKIEDNEEERVLNEEIEYFISLSKGIKKKLSDKRQAELVRFIKHTIKVRRVRSYRRDTFWEAAKGNHLRSEAIPFNLMHLFNIERMLGFRYSSNVVFQNEPLYTLKKMPKYKKYFLTSDLFEYIKYWFKDLSDEDSNDYQLRAITGFILSHIGLLKSDDDYKGSKPLKVYFADTVENWLKVDEDDGKDAYLDETP